MELFSVGARARGFIAIGGHAEGVIALGQIATVVNARLLYPSAAAEDLCIGDRCVPPTRSQTK